MKIEMPHTKKLTILSNYKNRIHLNRELSTISQNGVLEDVKIKDVTYPAFPKGIPVFTTLVEVTDD